MEQFLEFIVNNPLLTGAFAVLLGALIFTEMRKGGQSVTTQELTRLMNQEDGVVVDLREKKDFSRGSITGSLNIPLASLQSRIGELEKHKTAPIILVDAMGQHSGTAGKQLKDAGFENVVRLSGGISTWQGENLPLVKS
ncbi:rhodanese-like domain-containing protein [Parendozoicomonas haliclonae]|uniref:Molybdopterin biosynthesis protein MoeB n=1 Tax=Parendozoicomonas haliclonae TaxID=1960125 RepID=A0A1X7AG56_9GAMM|nr:rhodanese-like domain-containing protein [Parendozoicomonas haliclonae]SMA39335.1 molybdopterin biosynthesis protein MoeB [Parendozoicomonas haliclonae]